MSCTNHFIWNNKCEYCGLPACELGKKDHHIWDNKCEYCGLPSCQLNNKNNYRCRCCSCRRYDFSYETESSKKREEVNQNANDICQMF